MEVSGVIARSLPSVRPLDLKVSKRETKPLSSFSNLFDGFADKGHLKYYCSTTMMDTVTCGLKEKKVKKVKEVSEKGMLKKKLKLIKGLSKDLSMFTTMGFSVEESDLVGEVKQKKINEATEFILAQLQQLKAEEKEVKRKKKDEKIRQKAVARMNKCENSSNSSSSSSSDSECGEVVKMSSLRIEPKQLDHSVDDKNLVVEEASPSIRNMLTVDEVLRANENSFVSRELDCSTSYCSDVSNIAVTGNKIEVCMGGKCKKSGALALMEEFNKKIGIEGCVIGCKCMGKCRDAPNVRVLNTDTNSMCIGVGLEDVSMIISNFFGQERKNSNLVGSM